MYPRMLGAVALTPIDSGLVDDQGNPVPYTGTSANGSSDPIASTPTVYGGDPCLATIVPSGMVCDPNTGRLTVIPVDVGPPQAVPQPLPDLVANVPGPTVAGFPWWVVALAGLIYFGLRRGGRGGGGTRSWD